MDRLFQSFITLYLNKTLVSQLWMESSWRLFELEYVFLRGFAVTSGASRVEQIEAPQQSPLSQISVTVITAEAFIIPHFPSLVANLFSIASEEEQRDLS